MSLTDSILICMKILFPSINVKCTHNRVQPDLEQSYCPDCGKLVHNEWYITRCSCCGVKMKAMVKNGQVIPQNHFCSNCGSSEFSIEKVEKINFIDINFAALIKREEDEIRFCNTTKCWQERIPEQPKLLGQYL